MRARIYKPAKSPMQSGRRDRGWLLEYLPVTPRLPEPLMGWLSSGDTLGQVKIRFSELRKAVEFAEKNCPDYEIVKQNKRKLVPRNYAYNFRRFPATK